MFNHYFDGIVHEINHPKSWGYPHFHPLIDGISIEINHPATGVPLADDGNPRGNQRLLADHRASLRWPHNMRVTTVAQFRMAGNHGMLFNQRKTERLVFSGIKISISGTYQRFEGSISLNHAHLEICPGAEETSRTMQRQVAGHERVWKWW